MFCLDPMSKIVSLNRNDMVDNGMQKSCLTLIMVAPDRMQTNRVSQPHPFTSDYPMDNESKELRSIRPSSNESDVFTPNTEQLNDNSSSASTTIACDPLRLNEAIIPIKYIANDTHLNASHSNDIELNSKTRYCCTLEVKFIRYVIVCVLALFQIRLFPVVFFLFRCMFLGTFHRM